MPVNLPSPTEKLSVTLDGAIATLTISNESKRNAIDFEMWSALPSIMSALGDDGRVRAIVLRGAGSETFTSGADIGEFETIRGTAAGSRDYEARNETAFWAVAQCPKPVIAMIRGFCLGAGFGLALSCDIRIAESGSTFGIPAARLGVAYPPGAMRLIVANVGATAAKALFFTARRIGAEEALRLGAIQEIVPHGRLEEVTRSLAETIVANAPLTIRAAKAAIDHAAGIGPASSDPTALADACFDSEDYREGRRAFMEKRSPVFTGR